MSFWNKLFGSSKVVEDVVSATVSAGDKLVFTKEEKAEFTARFQEWYLDYLKATTPQNVARRYLMLMVGAAWLIVTLFGAFIWKLDPAWSGYLFGVMRDVINTPFMLIVGFYYAKNIAETWAGAKK